MIKRFRLPNLHVRYPCPRCGEDFHVFATFVEAKLAGGFLLWAWKPIKATWRARCAECGCRYTVSAEEEEPGG